MQKVMGPASRPGEALPLDVRIDEEVDCGSYCGGLLSYAAEPESRVPAYLLIPKKVLAQHTTARAILALHRPTRLAKRPWLDWGSGTNDAYGSSWSSAVTSCWRALPALG